MQERAKYMNPLSLANISLKVKVLVAQLYPTLCDPMDYSPPGSSVHGILQARIWSRLLFPSLGDLPDPGIKPGSPALQADSIYRSAKTNLGRVFSSLIHMKALIRRERDVTWMRLQNHL